MSHPTPLADELDALSASFAHAARTHQPLSAAELQRTADRLAQLGRRSAELERFHAEAVAEAQQEELRQTSMSLGDTGRDFLASFRRTYRTLPC